MYAFKELDGFLRRRNGFFEESQSRFEHCLVQRFACGFTHVSHVGKEEHGVGEVLALDNGPAVASPLRYLGSSEVRNYILAVLTVAPMGYWVPVRYS